MQGFLVATTGTPKREARNGHVDAPLNTVALYEGKGAGIVELRSLVEVEASTSAAHAVVFLAVQVYLKATGQRAGGGCQQGCSREE